MPWKLNGIYNQMKMHSNCGKIAVAYIYGISAREKNGYQKGIIAEKIIQHPEGKMHKKLSNCKL